MTLYVCLDDRCGMLFNKRRQSRDSALLEDIRANLPDTLTIDPFSEKLIQEAGIPYTLAPERAEDLDSACHFFLENRLPSQLLPLADRLIIYRWNRHYPADVHWDADPAELGFSLTESLEFPGTSHEKITKEVYTR